MMSFFVRKLKTIGGFDNDSRENMIEESQLKAILKCINFIRMGYQSDDWHYLPGIENENVQILNMKIKMGSRDINDFMCECSVRECAGALFYFLRSFSDYGLLPLRTQQLINANNKDVSSQVIALDALGSLLNELREENNINFIIIKELLQLMKILSAKSSLGPTEHLGSHAPYFLMPILFDKKASMNVIKNFTQCMNIVYELILHSHLISLNYHSSWKQLRAAEKKQQ